jgi:hypothetical protein
MAYIDVLPLTTAKNHLRVDDTADDAAITRMINTALAFIEKETNILVYQRDVTYLMVDGCKYVYDFPIDSVVAPADYDNDATVKKTNYSIYSYGSETVDLTLTVGYSDPADVPSELVDVALEIIDLMYHEKETGSNWRKDLSSLSKEILFNNKRFVL